MSMLVTVHEDDIAEAIYRGDLQLTRIVRALAREWADEGHTLLVEFEGVGEALAASKGERSVREFGAKLAEIAIQYDEKLLKEEQDEHAGA